MVRSLTAALAIIAMPLVAAAQQPLPPLPLYPGAVPRSLEERPLPPVPSGSGAAAAVNGAAPAPADAAASPPPAGREFCEQPVSVELADPAAVPRAYRGFVGMWSDAAWTADSCAALIVESVASDGTARIVYAFGPMAGGGRRAGGVLRGTGIIRDGELRFQNSDGSQFAFRPIYADLEGRLTTPKGQAYETIFKKTP